MAGSFGRRLAGVAGVLLAGVTLLVTASPASALIPLGARATPLVGSDIVANCPAGSGPVVDAGTGTANGVFVGNPAGARCTQESAAADGQYTIVGVTSPLPFSSLCTNLNGVVSTGGAVDVPAGTTVNGVVVNATTTVTALNAAVIFPGGRTAILNQVSTIPDESVTRNAIVFAGGPTVGQVICGVNYLLAVDTAGPAAPAVAAAPGSSGGDGGPSTALLIAGVVALAVLAQVAVGARMRRNRDSATT